MHIPGNMEYIDMEFFLYLHGEEKMGQLKETVSIF